ncbi:MAG TPA: ribosome-binding factor A [Candidatus Paceibacterota bacterium]|nr:ribosome-binding factor A [Candidatus Paceibacterota bacterium]
MQDNHHDRLENALREGAAEFLAREANRTSLVTVTRVMLSEDTKRAHIFITVLPDSAEEGALQFANRNRTELRDFLKSRIKGGIPGDIIFEIDLGEKNRQRLDELSQER